MIRVFETIQAQQQPAEKLFEMFSRGDRSSGRDQGGLRIGLALSRRLAQMHGGTVDARAKARAKAASSACACSSRRIKGRSARTRNPSKRPSRKSASWFVDDNRDAADSLSMEAPPAIYHYVQRLCALLHV